MIRTSWVSISLCLFAAVGARADRVALVAGGGTGGDGGKVVEARLVEPFAVGFDRAGNMYIAEMEGGERIRRVDRRGIITTVAGTGEKGYAGDGGPGAKAQVNGCHHLLVAPSGDVYIADTFNSRVRKLDPQSGIITTLAGTGVRGYSGDGGPAEKAQFGNIYCLAMDRAASKLYLDDLDNRRIRMIDLKTRIVSTVAGNGERGVPQDGADAIRSPLVDPRAVAVDSKGNIYILERSGHALRVVDTSGKIRTVAGTGKSGASGDGGDARLATLNGPKHLCIDRDDSVLIADTENHLIRRYQPSDGRIVRVAGCGRKGSAGLGGPPLEVELNQPHGVYVHPNGTRYIADSTNGRILRIER